LVPGLETGARLVSVGTRAACALMDSGEVECLGLGYGSLTKVSGLPNDVTNVACAAPYFDHTCVASPSAGVICWGSNNFGQLGNGMTTPSFTYQFEHANVIGLPPGVSALTAGSNDTCAITAGGALWCWGMNRYGQLGTGTFDSSSTPASVVGFSSGTAAVSAGEEYTCALTAQSTVRCWGSLADGKGNVASPVDIVGVSDAVALSVGGVTGCAVTRAGALKCWGAGPWKLGTGGSDNSMTQAVDPVGMSSGVVAVAVGEDGVCDVIETGAIYCWGAGPGGGSQLPKPLDGF
jgi:alpha-tubulin suppressor-like RCC1 family protein